MIGLFSLFLALVASPFKSKSRLEAENAVLRHQLIVLRRKVQGRIRLRNNDRWFLIQLYRWFPSILQAVTVVQPETLVRWHRAGFRWYWRWKSRSRGGRPHIEADLRALIRQMTVIVQNQDRPGGATGRERCARSLWRCHPTRHSHHPSIGFSAGSCWRGRE